MSSSPKDLRLALSEMADQYEAPDPHVVLAGAEAQAGALGRRRKLSRWAVVAAAAAVIGGAGMVLTGGDDTA
ncbi:MAG: hypothetical protein WBG57_05535, partial [Ornithinimicrobium sp.]